MKLAVDKNTSCSNPNRVHAIIMDTEKMVATDDLILKIQSMM
jgi:hypothetical protein